jgi:HSP20 family molecular chaperone IbpA
MSTLSVWTRRDPFADFEALVRNALAPVASQSLAGAFTPAAEVDRDGDDLVVRVELPGIDVDNDVTVEVVDDHLVVRGERRDERSEDANGRSLREVRYGAFRRSFTLPAHVRDDAVSATYDAGVLSVRILGAAVGDKARRIPVTSSRSVPAVGSGENREDEHAA